MIVVEKATICAGSFRLEGVDLQVHSGEYGVLMGETGSGKSTLVEGICGLRPVLDGRVLLGDRDVTRLTPAERNIGYVPQDAALFPRMNVRQHLAFPLSIRKWQRRDMDRRTEELAKMLAIGHLLDRSIQGLSGGEIQRVAIGRAMSWRPQILLLDEPLSALDEKTREEMYLMLKRVQRETGVTALHVTHSSSEARQLADHLFVLRQGGIVGVADDDANQPCAPQESHTA
ncbi:MAG: ABC transporter ATP-binding protein [Aeoliella sp.]